MQIERVGPSRVDPNRARQPLDEARARAVHAIQQERQP